MDLAGLVPHAILKRQELCFLFLWSSKTAANVTGTLSVILSTAKNWGYICEPVDFGKLVKPSEEVKEAARFFTADEARQIIAAAGHPFRTMFAIAAMTGMRVGEILALQTNDLDFERRMIHVRRSVWQGQIQTVKSKASKAPVPMPDALSVIEDLACYAILQWPSLS